VSKHIFSHAQPVKKLLANVDIGTILEKLRNAAKTNSQENLHIVKNNSYCKIFNACPDMLFAIVTSKRSTLR